MTHASNAQWFAIAKHVQSDITVVIMIIITNKGSFTVFFYMWNHVYVWIYMWTDWSICFQKCKGPPKMALFNSSGITKFLNFCFR